MVPRLLKKYKKECFVAVKLRQYAMKRHIDVKQAKVFQSKQRKIM